MARMQGASMAACGHMYLDQGDELEVGASANNLLSFSAALVPSANTTLGQVRGPVLPAAHLPHGRPPCSDMLRS